MPSARDLLQQADALMRSHRNVGSSKGRETVPVLTDVAIPGNAGVVTRQRVEEIPVLTNVVTDVPEPLFDLTIPSAPAPLPQRFPPTQTDPLLLPLSEMPPMPPLAEDDSVIARGERESPVDERVEPAAPIDDDMPKWLEADLLDVEPVDVARARTEGSHAPERLDWEPLPVPPIDTLPAQALSTPSDDSPSVQSVAAEPSVRSGDGLDETGSADGPAPAPLSDDDHAAADDVHGSASQEPALQQPTPSAEELAETVYFQVLQNLDLYTERALQQHMTAHLSPIIERATQELLTTLNANLGALIRQFVADAIEKQVGVRPPSERPPSET